MTKKTKISLILFIAVAILIIGVQTYTNYKIDQILQRFPYSLSENLSLHIIENEKNFFSRKLTLGVEDENRVSTEFISTKLTTFPLALKAELTLPENIIKELDKRFSIKIDKNKINSKFSLVGDYLQSDIVTEFRDLTNQPQILSLKLNFNYKDKSVEVQTDLTGFNYDNNVKLDELTGKITLVSEYEHKYDIASLVLKIKNTDIAILNGENTKLKFDGIDYSFNKNSLDNKYNAINDFKAKSFIISNKKVAESEYQSTINDLNIVVKQNEQDNNVNFSKITQLLTKNKLDINKLSNYLADLLFNNENFSILLSAKSVDIPKNEQPYLKLANPSIALFFDNQDRENAIANLDININSLEQNRFSENKIWNLKGLEYKQRLENINLNSRLALIPFYLDYLNNDENHQDNKKSLQENNLSNQELISIDLKLDYFNYPQEIEITDLVAHSNQKMPTEDQYQMGINLELAKLVLPQQAVSINDLKLLSPVEINNLKEILGFCELNNTSSCLISYESDFLDRLLENSIIKIADTSLDFDLDSYPATQKSHIKAKTKWNLAKLNTGDEIKQNWNDKIDNAVGNIDFEIAKSILTDSEKSKEIKQNSIFWNEFHSVLTQQSLVNELMEQNDVLNLRLERKEDIWLVNGKQILTDQDQADINEIEEIDLIQ